MVRNKLFFSATMLVLVLSLLPGCARTTKEPPPGKHEVLREVKLAGKWKVYHLRVYLEGSSEFAVLLKLADGDKVDGFFFTEKGGNIDLQVKADSSILYKSPPPTGIAGETVSDRFTFTASQASGTTYIISLKNTVTEKSTRTTTFLEIIYPATGAVYIPLEAK